MASKVLLCNKRMPTRLKNKLYKAVDQLAMLYSAVLDNHKRANMQDVDHGDMYVKMSAWQNSYGRSRNERIRKYLIVALIKDNTRERRQVWYGHVMRRLTTT